MTTIYLVRHAQAEGNLYRRFHGQFNTDLTGTGLRQLKPLARRFALLPLDAVYSSDLARARRTAEAIAGAKGLSVRLEPRFREVDVGVWDNLPFGELEQHHAEDYALLRRDPQRWHVEGAERWADYTGRFLAALDELAARHDGGSIAVVTHWMILEQVLNRLFPGQWQGYCDNTAVTCVEAAGGGYTLRYAIDSSHLPPALSTYAAQRTLREHPELHYNLWYQTALHDPERYIQYRREAWELVYGDLRGFDGPAFWSTAVKTCEDDPAALVYAMSGNQIAGILQLNVNGYAALNAGYIPFIYMREAYRHKGLGIQLIGYAALYFQALGRDKLQLSVAPQNLPAIGFYEKYGFHRVAVTGGRNKLWRMEKDITAAPSVSKT